MFRIISAFLIFATLTFAQPLPKLLKTADADAVRGATVEPGTRGMRTHRSRFVEIDQSVLFAPVNGARRLALDLFADAQFEVQEQRSYWSEDGTTFSWIGKIAGMERGHVVLAVTGDIVSANINTDNNAFYWIRRASGKVHSVQQVEVDRKFFRNDTRVPDGVVPVGQPDDEKDHARAANPERAAGETAFVDVLICYTPKAKNAAGGEQGILNRIQLSVTETNLAYANSNVKVHIHPVKIIEVNYNESAGIDQALDDIRDNGDGKMDEVHSIRNQYGADLVALFIEDRVSNSGIAGLAFIMQTVNTSFASHAFSVTEQYWAPGPLYAFPHELGHNMGSAHDRANASNPGAYPYSYGYQNRVGTPFATIMAYDCTDIDCPPIPYFSSPLISYAGRPTGLTTDDNARSLTNTGPTVANFRSSAGSCTYSASPMTNSLPATAGAGVITITAATGCAWTAQSSAAFVTITNGASGTGNGTVNYTVQANTGAERSGTIVAAGQIVTINQASGTPSCSFTLSPGNASYPAAGGAASVTVNTTAGCQWTATTANGWITINSGANGTGTGSVNYTVASNPGFARTGSISIAGRTFSITQSAGGSGVTYTITTNPAGLIINVDGTNYPTPQTFNWPAGSSHTLNAATQGTGTRYLFQSWSNGGQATQTITAPQTATTYLATFRRQFLMALAANPSNGGSVVGTPPSGDAYYDANASVQVTASAAPNFQFGSWSGAVLSSLNPISIFMDSPKTLTANFVSGTNNFTITTSPPGLLVVADGVEYVTPKTFNWPSGSYHMVEAPQTQQGNRTRYTFAGWSDSAPQSHGVTVMPGNTTLTASFSMAHQLSMAVGPAGAGSVGALPPPSSDGYYSAGTMVQLNAAAASGYGFAGWSGDLSGSAQTQNITINSPKTVNANFTVATACSFQLTHSSTSVLASGDIRQVGVTAGTGCAWTALSTAGWITVLSGNNGSGNGAVRLMVSANTGTGSRSGTVSIAGQNYVVTQSGAGCSYTLSGSNGVLPGAAASYVVNIATQPGCQWSASTTAGWIALTGATSGTGSGTISFSVPLNAEAAPRTAAIVAGGQWYHMLQKSASMGQLFNDVPASHGFFDFIGMVRLRDITQGCGSGVYCPDEVMTRAEMAAFIVRALYGETFTFNPVAYFTDVPVGHTHFKYVQKMKDLGITSGCGATTYCPGDPVTRGQMAVFLVRARLGIANGESFPSAPAPYFDDVPANHVFFPFIQKMKELGITAGCSATSYCSDSPNTRGQMAVFVTRDFF